MIKTYQTTINLLRVLKRKNYFSLKQFKGVSSDRILCILGNGKSLNETKLSKGENIDYMVVNRHVLADNYKEIKPAYYVLADPHFFQHPEGLSILKKINDSTIWKMAICIPYNRKVRKVIKQYITNDNLNVIYYNNLSFAGFSCVQHLLYKWQLAMPVVQNVLVASIMIGILSKYQRIELYGVEHTWTKYLYVDENNVVYLENPHFFDKEKVDAKPVKEIQHTDEYPFYLILENYSRMFKSYWEIKDYIKAKNITTVIINKSKGSFIDAFKKE